MVRSWKDGEHEKTVYAHFGLAYYMASVFETGLALAIVQLEFLTSVRDRIERDGYQSFDAARYRADFDAFLEQQQTKTLGTLLKRVDVLTTLDPPLKALVSKAKAKRDFLAHHYFRERAEQFVTREGRSRMIAELEEATKIFDSADRNLDAFLQPHRDSLGLTKERVEARLAAYLKSVANEV